MTVNADQFREGMRRLGGAVTIVTSQAGDVHAGLTATAVTSLSAEPPRLLACINQQGETFKTISEGRNMCVNVLGVGHQSLAMEFAGMTNKGETERFNDPRWNQSIVGANYLSDALVSFHCEVENILDTGSHGVVIGFIKDIYIGGEKIAAPLFYMDGDWKTLSSDI